MKQTLLIAGCGDVALRAAPLLQAHYRLLGMYRRPENRESLRLQGITPVFGDLDIPDSLSKISGLAHAVLHLAPPPNLGRHDSRTANLLAALTRTRRPKTKIKAAMLPQRLVYISTSGVYGDCEGRLVDETHVLNPQTERALRRVDAERQLRSWGLRTGVSVSILRVPGIYAGNRLPLARLRDGIPALLPEQDSFTNHIHADDLARIVVAALRLGRPGRVYHACDDSHLKMGEYFDLIADRFGLPRPPRVSRAEAEGQISPGMLSFMRESRRLINTRLKHELHVDLRYPTVRDCFAEGG
ncbi:Nucleoside-diphosphate-sugar epimerase [Nitrosospira sp. Nsp14]|uniref:SDR family oxidoreductase n=1 Tax=Nitrosospira sp. Nsp14 TaxID=1855333 RepID=UPI0008DFC86A|nr:SDR family oxidoreductase [Nitrosospira sp. Nsp14]SFH37425.1 Nucleoside-diphosphate-sugar epimerase [Nitrosospira sp. Nsp14]